MLRRDLEISWCHFSERERETRNESFLSRHFFFSRLKCDEMLKNPEQIMQYMRTKIAWNYPLFMMLGKWRRILAFIFIFFMEFAIRALFLPLDSTWHGKGWEEGTPICCCTNFKSHTLHSNSCQGTFFYLLFMYPSLKVLLKSCQNHDHI